jgi:capsular exopolysaccharide synthesis family protein
VIDAKFAFGSNLYNSSYLIFNEMGILRSYSLTQRALKNLDFTVCYYSRDRFKKNELYKDCPFIFIIDSGSPQPLFTDIQLKIISSVDLEIKINSQNTSFYSFTIDKFIGAKPDYIIDSKVKLNQSFLLNFFAGKIIPRNSVDLQDYVGKTYYFELFNQSSLIQKYRGFTVSENRNSSIVTLSIVGHNVEKMADFLNALSKEYMVKGLEKKNQIADNTIRFIDSQLGEVTDSLFFSEKRLQEFRANNAVMNVDFQTQQIFSAMDNLQNQKVGFEVKNKYYKYLKEYLKENKDGHDLVVPAAMGIEDVTLSGLINELTKLFAERWEISQNLKRDNPMVTNIDNRINNTKKSILDNVESMLHATKISIQDIDQRIDVISSKVNKLPETERKLFGYERKFKLNDALYTFLLTKRSEVQISKASYMPDNEILDIARDTEFRPIAPNRKRNYLIAFIIGLSLPIAFLVLKDFFNDKIRVNEDIERATDYPIIGYVVHNKEKTYTIVADDPLSLTSESIRAIRTNFQFVGNEKGKNVVLITSSMMGEGKSFISINLAISFALNNKKTILVNFDLRKPKVQDYLEIDNERGLSLYLSGNAGLSEIITKTAYNNFDIIMAGAIPPNPMELIAGPRTKVLIDKLKEDYDFIILDSPPISMVADSMLLVNEVDTILYVARQGYTLKHVFIQQMQNLFKRGIKNVNIILNDVQLGRKYQSYSHGYAYTYGYGYNTTESKEKSKKV